MKLVIQPRNSNQCGQACLATLLGLTLQEAINRIGTTGKTTTRDIRRGLKLSGIQCDDRRVLGHPAKDETAFVFWRKGRRFAHWMLWHNRKYYDPASGVHRKPPKWVDEHGLRITSYLKVH